MLTANRNWPAALFSAALCLVAITMIILSIPAEALCEKSETVTACLRNWANALGNGLAFIAASLAAVFAYRQFRAARRQALLASLEPLETRALLAERIIRQGTSIRAMTVFIEERLQAVETELSKADLKRIGQLCYDLRLAAKTISDAENALAALLDHGIIDAHLSQIATLIANTWVNLRGSHSKVFFAINAIGEKWQDFTGSLPEQLQELNRFNALLALSAELSQYHTAVFNQITPLADLIEGAMRFQRILLIERDAILSDHSL